MSLSPQTRRSETSLYPVVKRFLEGAGYEVKGEVHGCDVVALRGGEDIVVVEMKLALNLDVLLQAVDRLAVTERVYVAVSGVQRKSSRLRDRRMMKLLRLLGLGLLAVNRAGDMDVLLEPAPYRPRKNGRRHKALLNEYRRRSGDPNSGGSTRRPLMTAYRQDALRCAVVLTAHPVLTVAQIRGLSGVESAGRVLLRNVYGWFERAGRGRYGLTDSGRQALGVWEQQVAAFRQLPREQPPAAEVEAFRGPAAA